MDLPETFVPGFHDENEVRKMKYNPLGFTGMNVSQIALGTGGFSYLYGEFDIEECKRTVHDALRKGINIIDTAPFYGHGVSEEVLGKCLEGIPRKAYYLNTKVGRYDKDIKIQFNFTAEKTRQSVDTSLRRLGVDYVDIIQAKKIGIICAAANAMGLLSSFGPPDWNPATQHIRDICTEAREYCKKIGVELGKLAVYHTLQQKGPDTVLIGMNKRNVLEYNLDVLYNGLTQKEHEAYTEVMKILNKLKQRHWENIEVTNYWKTIRGPQS
ncbi:hypothetical protein NQ317_005850 [Molorchus minor]|uniref:NADP-dependent oxidoreductase domain-containing protein n=1 Tax=Molorchus minor TaxID=1323400 RepID=A0ABQ9IV43_9CUCU|nr:hypothetical protein NQ317_005850 [Molorchus minor]